MSEDEAYLVSQFFRGLVMAKLEFRGPHLVYGAKVPSMYQSTGRYVFATVDMTRHAFDAPERVLLTQLPWDSLQTRQVARDSDRYRLRTQQWRGVPRKAPDFLFRIVTRERERSRYVSAGGQLTAEMLHTPSKGTVFQFHNSIPASSAVETFQTIIARVT